MLVYQRGFEVFLSTLCKLLERYLQSNDYIPYITCPYLDLCNQRQCYFGPSLAVSECSRTPVGFLAVGC